MLLIIKYSVKYIALSLSLYYVFKLIEFNNLIYLLRHAILKSKQNLHKYFLWHTVFEYISLSLDAMTHYVNFAVVMIMWHTNKNSSILKQFLESSMFDQILLIIWRMLSDHST